MVNATYTVNCSILLTDIPLLDRPRAARDAGFDGSRVLVAVRHPVTVRRRGQAFIRAIEDAGVQLTGLNFAAGDMPAGDRGILSNPRTDDRTSATASRSPSALPRRWAPAPSTRCTATATHGSRRRPRTTSPSTTWRTPRLAADRIGATVLLEPVSGAPRYPLKTAADVIRGHRPGARPEYGTTNLRLLADLYHLDVNGDDT